MVKTLEERFWEKVDKRGSDECWEWKGARNGSGYGQMTINKIATQSTHVALLLDGIDVPSGMMACHSCDNRTCVNPGHLFVGDQLDNMRDMHNKGRANRAKGVNHGSYTHPERTPRGITHHARKLTEYDIHMISFFYETKYVSQRDISKEFGVSNQQISRIVRRKNWTHIEKGSVK